MPHSAPVHPPTTGDFDERSPCGKAPASRPDMLRGETADVFAVGHHLIEGAAYPMARGF